MSHIFYPKEQPLLPDRGEILDYFNYKIPFHILIVLPNINISTKWVYENIVIEKFNSPSNFKINLLESLNNVNILKERITNKFEPLVFGLYPELALIKDTLYKHNAVYAQMTGSGSAIYGFYKIAPGC